MSLIILTSAIVSSITGALWTLFSAWLLEKQKNSFTTQIEKLSKTLEYKNHISSIQFEKEFEIYQNLWAFLLPMRLSVLNLRPMLDSYNPSESKEERQRKRLKKFYESIRAFRDCIESSRPFMDIIVYNRCVDVLKKSNAESIEYEVHDPKEQGIEYWNSQKNNHKEIENSIEEACEAIRNRLSNVIIIN